MSASVVSGGDAPPILDPAKHVLDTISLPIEDFVVVGRVASLLAWWNAGRNPLVFQSVAKPVGVIAAICQQLSGFRQTIEQVPGTLVVAGLARGEEKQQGPASPSVTACSLEFRPPFVRPIQRERAPFLADWLRCDGL